MQIKTKDAYRDALDRINQLRGAGRSPERTTEIAELEAAVAAYEAAPDQPDTTPGKPTPSPYEKPS
ncbi:MAG: hypothetical protein IPM60_12030 [Rhodospirillales bacterium]|nr:hypothetical protein [Rhodospirillales bacterium]